MPYIDTGGQPESNASSTGSALGVYRALLEQEQRKHEARGGRRALVRDNMVMLSEPGPLLKSLLGGEPVTVDEFLIPREYRQGKLTGRRVTVLPDDTLVY